MVWVDSAVAAMSPGQLTLVVFACSLGSLLIGAVGIGGVIILPALIVAGVEPAVGIVTFFSALSPMALLRLVLLARTEGLIPWRAALSAGVAAALGAGTGGLLLDMAPKTLLTFLVGAVAMLAGIIDSASLIRTIYQERIGKGPSRHQEKNLKTSKDRQSLEEPQDNGKGELRQEARNSGKNPKFFDDEPAEAIEKRICHVDLRQDCNVLCSPNVDTDDRDVQKHILTDAEPSKDCPDCSSGISIQNSFSFSTPRTDDGATAPETRSPQMKDGEAKNDKQGEPHQLEPWKATWNEALVIFVIGLVTGLVSVMTGTGGPLMFLPIVLTWKGNSVSRQVIVGSTAVLAASLSFAASISTLIDGLRPDIPLTLIIGSCALAGVSIGVHVLKIASREVLQGGMSVILLAVAGLTIWQASTQISSRRE